MNSKYEVLFEPLRIIHNGKTYSCEEVQWYNFTEGSQYLMMHDKIQRIGTFQRFKWIAMYSQWFTVFTHVYTNEHTEYCQECAISGGLPYIYYKLY